MNADNWRLLEHRTARLFGLSGYIENRPSAVRTSPIKMPSLINSNLAASGGKGKNQKPIAARTKATASSRVKKIRTAEKLPPLLLKYGGKLTTPKIFFCIIAASLSLMGMNTIRLRHKCDADVKPLRPKIFFYEASQTLTIACAANKIV